MSPATILVVDDDPATLLVCRKNLCAEGYAVVQAAGSSEALKLFAEHDGAIHLVLTEIMLAPPGFQLSVENNPFPRVNGLRACGSTSPLREKAPCDVDVRKP